MARLGEGVKIVSLAIDANKEQGKLKADRRKLLIACQTQLAMAKHLFRHSVALIPFDENDKMIYEPGSGTLIQIKDRFYIATAGHVIKNVIPNNIAVIGTTFPARLRPNIVASGFRDEPCDIAWLEIGETTYNELSTEAVQLDRITGNCFHVPNDLVALCAAPGSMVDKDKLSQAKYQACFLPVGTITIDVDKWPELESPTSRDVDIFLEYPQDNIDTAGNYAAAPDAPGMSGGGIWALRLEKLEIWSPDKAQLIGIQKSWGRVGRWLRATQMQHWLKMIYEDNPDLLDPS